MTQIHTKTLVLIFFHVLAQAFAKHKLGFSEVFWGKGENKQTNILHPPKKNTKQTKIILLVVPWSLRQATEATGKKKKKEQG